MTPSSLPTVTALYAALNGVLNIGLAYRVSTFRRRDKVSMGATDGELLEAVRTHANHAEFVPFALLLLLIAELCGTPAWALHGAGEVLFLSRLAHVLGMRRPAPNPLRYWGNAGTWGMMILTSIWLIALRFVPF